MAPPASHKRTEIILRRCFQFLHWPAGGAMAISDSGMDAFVQ